jgi:hypothetical protein
MIASWFGVRASAWLQPVCLLVLILPNNKTTREHLFAQCFCLFVDCLIAALWRDLLFALRSLRAAADAMRKEGRTSTPGAQNLLACSLADSKQLLQAADRAEVLASRSNSSARFFNSCARQRRNFRSASSLVRAAYHSLGGRALNILQLWVTWIASDHDPRLIVIWSVNPTCPAWGFSVRAIK